MRQNMKRKKRRKGNKKNLYRLGDILGAKNCCTNTKCTYLFTYLSAVLLRRCRQTRITTTRPFTVCCWRNFDSIEVSWRLNVVVQTVDVDDRALSQTKR